MAAVDPKTLDASKLSELACTYASLVLLDDNNDITQEKLEAIISAAGLKADKHFTQVFAKSLNGKDLGAKLNAGGAGAGGAQPAASAPAAAEKKAEVKKEEPKKEEEEEVGVGGLFDF
eukprot:TRINITY_DN1748_c0_g1_i1.p1 TRINITY_DN1748_c0_g1~~TRINITY_DN1748_c0_g1_i1.p1  ORF type:complete len:118 (-),score=61.14 TRINITY_DN1748_c0_g1_i1:164-517(-)